MEVVSEFDLRPDVEPLTKAEKAWLRRLERVFAECPSTRLGLYTIGDADLTVFDDAASVAHGLDIHDNRAEENGIRLGAIRTRVPIAATTA